MRVTLDLDAADERSIVRLLRALLKTLGRTYRVRVRSIRPATEEEK